MCHICQEGEPFGGVTLSGRPELTNGHYFIHERHLLAFQKSEGDLIIQDRIPIRFCPECGRHLPKVELIG